MKNIFTNKIREGVVGGEPLGFFHEYNGRNSLIFLRRSVMTSQIIWKLVIDVDDTEEVIELGWKVRGVSESDAKLKAQEILKEKGIDYDISNLKFNWDGST